MKRVKRFYHGVKQLINYIAISSEFENQAYKINSKTAR